MSNPLRTHVKKFLLYTFWEIGPSFINKYIVSVSIYERLAGVTSKLAQNEYTGPASNILGAGTLRVHSIRLRTRSAVHMWCISLGPHVCASTSCGVTIAVS